MRLLKWFIFFYLLITGVVYAQPVPSASENIDFICTFGKEAELTWGDDDNIQTFFFIIPKASKKLVYIRVFDPDCGGQRDQMNIIKPGYDTKTRFSIFGGPGAYTDEDAREPFPKGNYKSGNLLKTVTFGAETTYDNKWYSFGPFNPAEGEYIKEFDAYVIKVVSESFSGNDGNLYRYYLSNRIDANVPVDGSNAFTYKYSFRLKSGGTETAHLYPLIDESVVSIRQYNFDFDNEGMIKLYSVSKNGLPVKISGEGNWATSEHPVTQAERGKSLNFQIVKNQERLNDMTFYILNQYDKAIPFFAVPIGGVPKFRFSVGITYDYINKKSSVGN